MLLLMSGGTYSSLAHHSCPSSVLFHIHHTTWNVGISCSCVHVACILLWTSCCQNSRRTRIRCTRSRCLRPSLLGGKIPIRRLNVQFLHPVPVRPWVPTCRQHLPAPWEWSGAKSHRARICTCTSCGWHAWLSKICSRNWIWWPPQCWSTV